MTGAIALAGVGLGDLPAVEPVAVVALLFGVVWVYVNGYYFYPTFNGLVRRALGRPIAPRETISRPAEAEPEIDVLVCAYREASVIDYAVDSIRRADYPTEKLTVSVLVEPDDTETREALDDIPLEFVREVVVPEEYPGTRNKPRALDYGFEVTDADIVGVIDAEDVVAPELFRYVVNAIEERHFDFAQGRLDMVNEDDGLLNTLFRGEYGFWYRIIIPSFQRLHYPVPLGGTTNFFRRGVLEEVAERREERFGSVWTDDQRDALETLGLSAAVPWDPRNVAEDFDIGLLLWSEGYEMAIIDAVTREESPLRIREWVRQRTRWQKGKLFTLRQALRNPPDTWTERYHYYTLGAVPHLGPINVLGIVLVFLYANVARIGVGFWTGVVLALGLAFVVQHALIQAYSYSLVTDEPRRSTRWLRTVGNAVFLPLYWILEWVSDVRAMKQLYANDLSWEKTPHYARHVTGPDPFPDVSGARPEGASTGGARPEGASTGGARPEGAAVTVRRTDAGWTWSTGADGATLSSSAPHETREAAVAAADGLRLSVGGRGRDGSTVRVVREADGWHWRLLDADGAVAARSVATYETRSAPFTPARPRSPQRRLPSLLDCSTPGA